MILQPSASYSLTIRTENAHRPGMVAQVASAIGEDGGLIGAIDTVSVGKDTAIRDFTVAARAGSALWRLPTARSSFTSAASSR